MTGAGVDAVGVGVAGAGGLGAVTGAGATAAGWVVALGGAATEAGAGVAAGVAAGFLASTVWHRLSKTVKAIKLKILLIGIPQIFLN